MLENYRRHILYFLVNCILILSVVLRIQQERFSASDLRLITIFLAGYFVLTVLQPVVTRWHRLLVHIYAGVQIAFVFLLVIVTDEPFDYFAVLFLPICYKLMVDLPQNAAFAWNGFLIFCLVASQVESYDWLRGIGYALPYIAVAMFIIALGIAIRRSEQARSESQALLAELQVANQKLQAYTLQVEELAAAHERNRLARELHDSATQTVFSIVLTAQSARILLNRDPERAGGLLDHLQELAQNALAEMRSLILQLRPTSIAEDGLETALRKHFAARQLQEDLFVDFQVEGSRRLPLEVEEALFRVVQEALNNVRKHAGTNQAVVSLRLDDPVQVTIEDHGCGFELQVVQQPSHHVGLASMAERVQALGGSLTIESKPGHGTRIRAANLDLMKE